MIFCLECLQDVEYEIVVEKTTTLVRDEQITIEERIPKCKCCGERVFVKEIDDENLSNAYDTYKKKKGLLTSMEIKSIREKHGLTQSQFARLLKLGEKSITRYENGAIQDGSIDTLIRMAESESSFKQLVKLNGNRLSEKEYKAIENRIEEKAVITWNFKYSCNKKRAYIPKIIEGHNEYSVVGV